MESKGKRLIAAALLSGLLTGCSATATHTAATQATQATTQAAASPTPPASPTPSPSQSSADTGTVSGTPMACTDVIDSDPSQVGLKAASLTTEQMIGYLIAVLAINGVNMSLGNPSSAGTTVLTAGILDLKNYQGDKLADDAGQFVQDAENFTGYPYSNNQVDTSAYSAMQADIFTLGKDCPGAMKTASAVMNGG